MTRIRLLLIDDHVLFRESLGRLLGSEPDFEVVADCRTAEAALEVLHGRLPTWCCWTSISDATTAGASYCRHDGGRISDGAPATTLSADSRADPQSACTHRARGLVHDGAKTLTGSELV